MASLTAPRGTRDVLPDEWRLRHRAVGTFRRIVESAGYGRIMTPTFEHTEVFARGVGESTDVVGKEMYTFTDRGDRSLSLRPEGTAAVARAFVEHGMQKLPLPVKLYYFAPMFRYEKPQEGRYREHWQLGAEALGSDHPAVDAEMIALLDSFYRELGVPGVTLKLNTLGDETDRPAYRELLVAYLRKHESELDADSQRRIDTNPLRVFDSKDARTREIMVDAPRLAEHLSDTSRAHFDAVRELLEAAGIAYVIDDSLVRGLDYYTHTTFEFSCSKLGAQDAVGGGGRYNGLIEKVGGAPTPGVGFGCGIERVLIAMQAGDVEVEANAVDVYVVVDDEARRPELFAVTAELRAQGLRVEGDLVGRSAKGQRKQASRLGAALALIGGTDGLVIHHMQGRAEQPTTRETALADIHHALAHGAGIHT